MRRRDGRIGWRDRWRLRRSARRIFARMVQLDTGFNAVINRLENRGRDGIRLIILGGVGAGIFFALSAVSRAGWIEGMPVPLPETGQERALAAGVASLILYILVFGRWFAARAESLIETATRVLILSRAVMPGRKRREPILGAVREVIRTRPGYAATSFSDLHDGKRPADTLSPRFVKRVRQTVGPGGPGFIRLRGAFEKRPLAIYLRDWFRSPHPEVRERRLGRGLLRKRPRFSYFIEARQVRNGLAASLLFDVLGAELRDEIRGGADWRRDYVTKRDRQSTAVFDHGDLHNRFRTNSPHYRWPVEENEDSVGETAIYRIIQCVENPCSLPLYVIRARDVVARFEEVIAHFYEECRGPGAEATAARQERLETVIGKLVGTNVKMFGKFSEKTLQATSEAGVQAEPVLKDLALSKKEHEDPGRLFSKEGVHDWGLRWDANQIDWFDLAGDQDTETTRAFAILMEAIDRERARAKAVRLRRGDGLVVDNLRCLVARQEPPPRAILPALLAMPQEWWLAGFYGFRRSRSPVNAGGAEEAPPDEGL